MTTHDTRIVRRAQRIVAARHGGAAHVDHDARAWLTRARWLAACTTQDQRRGDDYVQCREYVADALRAASSGRQRDWIHYHVAEPLLRALGWRVSADLLPAAPSNAAAAALAAFVGVRASTCRTATRGLWDASLRSLAAAAPPDRVSALALASAACCGSLVRGAQTRWAHFATLAVGHDLASRCLGELPRLRREDGPHPRAPVPVVIVTELARARG